MKTVLLQMNEVNFDIVESYLARGCQLPRLAQLARDRVTTHEYESYSNLEPWIQWVSFYVGRPYKEHGVFRLGDGVTLDSRTIFEVLSSELGISVGAVAPMNLNPGATNFDFYLPDPWSGGCSKGAGLEKLSYLISRAVNGNSGPGFTLKFYAELLFEMAKLLKFRDHVALLKALPWRLRRNYGRAIFLDEILARVHIRLMESHNTEFSSVFLNACAHLQHHYFLNSKAIDTKSPCSSKNPTWYIRCEDDPVLEVLESYERILSWYESSGARVAVMTGLQQVPVAKSEFYYRLSHHEDFLSTFDINFTSVKPRMTRDFLVEFSDKETTLEAAAKLKKIKADGNNIFGVVDIRDCSIFCSLTYDDEILPSLIATSGGVSIRLYEHVNFVAIKNGIHDPQGTYSVLGRKMADRHPKPVPVWKCGELLRDLIYNEREA